MLKSFLTALCIMLFPISFFGTIALACYVGEHYGPHAVYSVVLSGLFLVVWGWVHWLMSME